MSGSYVLNPHARAAAYANKCYVYDSRLAGNPLVEIPAGQIGEVGFAAFQLLKTRGFLMEARSPTDIRQYLADNDIEPEMFDRLVKWRLLKPYRAVAMEVERRVLDYFNRRYVESDGDGGRPDDVAYDPDLDTSHFTFARNTFFNVPDGVDPEECHVGIIGVCQSSLGVSFGTEMAPDQLRLQSRSLSWLDIHRQGAYSEVVLDSGRPEVICEGVVLGDCGNVRFESLGLAEMFDTIAARLDADFFQAGVYPLIVGGDHAITYPIVTAFLAHTPDLGLLHLDAHNDLFYTPHVVHSHAAPVSNLIRRTSIERVASFGLRTFTDTRMAGINKIYDDPDTDARIHLRSLTRTKQLIMHPALLEAELRALAGRPYYITLDLDVLSEVAIGGQVSTPFGGGLEWDELLTFLIAAFELLDVVGFDIVEYNGFSGHNGSQLRYYINSLLMIVIDGLARNNPKYRYRA